MRLADCGPPLAAPNLPLVYSCKFYKTAAGVYNNIIRAFWSPNRQTCTACCRHASPEGCFVVRTPSSECINRTKSSRSP